MAWSSRRAAPNRHPGPWHGPVNAYLEDVTYVAEALGARCFVKSDFLEHATNLLAEFTGIEPVARTELV